MNKGGRKKIKEIITAIISVILLVFVFLCPSFGICLGIILIAGFIWKRVSRIPVAVFAIRKK